MADLTERQMARNRETQNQSRFASYRVQVMRLISDAAAAFADCVSARSDRDSGFTITVIGAGNCQDIDLTELAT